MVTTKSTSLSDSAAATTQQGKSARGQKKKRGSRPGKAAGGAQNEAEGGITGKAAKQAEAPQPPAAPPIGWGAWLANGLFAAKNTLRAAPAATPAPTPPPAPKKHTAHRSDAPNHDGAPQATAAFTPKSSAALASTNAESKAASDKAVPDTATASGANAAAKHAQAATQDKTASVTHLTATSPAQASAATEKHQQTPSTALVAVLVGRNQKAEHWAGAISDRQLAALDTALTLASRCKTDGTNDAAGMQAGFEALFDALAPKQPAATEGPLDTIAFAALLDPAFGAQRDAVLQRTAMQKKALALHARLGELIAGAKSLRRDPEVQAWNKKGGSRMLKALADAAQTYADRISGQNDTCRSASKVLIAEHIERLDPQVVTLAAAHPELRDQVAHGLRLRYAKGGHFRQTIAHDPHLRQGLGWLHPNAGYQRTACDLDARGYDQQTVAVRVLDLALNNEPRSFAKPSGVSDAWRMNYYKKSGDERAFFGVHENGERVLVWYDHTHVAEGAGGTYGQAYLRNIYEGFRKLEEV